MKNPGRASSLSDARFFLFLAALSFAFYWRILNNPFWDPEDFNFLRTVILNTGDWTRLFSPHAAERFHPIPLIFFQIEYHFFAFKPEGYYAVNLLVHAFNAILVHQLVMVLLVGLVAKNSILLIDLANQLRAEGKQINEALLEACPIRMRPVLMTSLTIIISMLPAAMGVGAGSDTNRPLAVAVIGGMISSTLLTLIVVPAVYSLVEHGFEHFERIKTHGIRHLWLRDE